MSNHSTRLLARLRVLPARLFHLVWGLALLASFAHAAPPAAWSSRVWQADDGLLDNRVTGLAQATDGALWVATRGGLLRFDGSTFEEFHLSVIDGVVGNGGRAMFPDRHGNLWVGAFREAVVRIGPTSAQSYAGPEGIPEGAFSGIADGRDGTLWLAFGEHVGRLEAGHYKELHLPEGPGFGGRAALSTDNAGRVWGVVNGQVGQLRGDSFSVRYRMETHDAALAAARDGGLWVCDGGQLLLLHDNSPPERRATLPADVRPVCLLEDKTGGVWVGTLSHGLFHCAGRDATPVAVSHQQVGSILEDTEGNIWVGTLGGGLNRLRPRAVELQGIQADSPSVSVVSVCQDADGACWAVTASGQLVRSDGKKWSPLAAGDPWSGDSAACVAADRQGRLWIGMKGQGLLEVDLRARTHRVWLSTDGLPSNSVRSLFVASDDSLWIATGSPTGLANLKAGALRTVAVPASVRNIRPIVQDRTGNILIGTSDGQVLRVAGADLVRPPGLEAAIPTSVRCMHPTADGSLWIGYAGKAIARLKDGRYSLMTGPGSLVPDSISQFASDQSGALWMAGTRGMYKVTLNDAVAKAEGRAQLLQPAFYGRAEGLPNIQPLYDSFPTVCESRDGTLLFSTSLGVLAVTPENLRSNPVPPPVRLDAVLVDEQAVAVRDPLFPLRPTPERKLGGLGSARAALQLAPDHHRLTMGFSALSFSGSENVRYRYRLDGFDEEWSEPGPEREAHYSRLPAGDYIFRVTACNDTGIWSEIPATVAITVSPFVWQRWWFRAAVLAAFTAAVAAIVRLVSFRRLQARLRRTEQDAVIFQERTRIARDIHDDLGGSLAHIKLLSEIALQDRAMPEVTEANLRKITATTRKVLKDLDETIWAVSPGNDTLPHLISYLGQYAVEFLRTAGIACPVDLPDAPPEIEITSAVRHHVYLAFKEALTNVVKHSGARTARLEIQVGKQVLRIVLEDDGCGLAPGPADAHADGLANMRQRMNAVGGSLVVRSSPGEGTRLEFVLGLESRG